jgi:microcystin-dependent protein
MADSNTTNYAFTLPEVGASDDTWGTKLNANWSSLDTDLKTVSDTSTTAFTYRVPAGGIIMWSGAVVAIPSGWVICDGANGTPDLRNRFLVGAGDTYAVGATGGAATVTLDATQIPAHSHTADGDLTAASAGAHTHTGTTSNKSLTGSATYIAETWANFGVGSGIISKEGGYGNDGTPDHTDSSSTGKLNIDASHDHTFTTASNGAHTHDITGSTSNTGGGLAHENLPPYYALAYIMKS